jgi:galactokinase
LRILPTAFCLLLCLREASAKQGRLARLPIHVFSLFFILFYIESSSAHMTIAEQIRQAFIEEFQSEPFVFSSPGRVNIIGEHTDYNGGFVLPAAINKAAYLAIAPSGKATGKWISTDFKDFVEINFGHIGRLPQHWANYLLGVIHQFQKAGQKIQPFNCIIAADVPIGSGLSSSAALESVTAFAINHLNEINYSLLDLALLTQRAENEFIGLKCGIMDMFASLHGKKNHAMRLDCRSYDFDYIPIDLGEYNIVLLDTGVKHSLASSEYNIRREQCEEGIHIIGKFYPGIKTLRDINAEMLDKLRNELPPVVYRRCRFILEENERVFGACLALQNRQLKMVGKLMYASHRGLQYDYEVSCQELDILVDLVKEESSVIGARMMGGGFGGCTINIIEAGQVNNLFEKIAPAYHAQTGKNLSYSQVVTGDGAALLSAYSPIQQKRYEKN